MGESTYGDPLLKKFGSNIITYTSQNMVHLILGLGFGFGALGFRFSQS
jgi:hypothetical protein